MSSQGSSTMTYTASVREGETWAMFVVWIYPGVPVRGFSSAEFRGGPSQFDDSRLTVPGGRQASFREELRVTGKAWDYFEASCDDVPYIEAKLREAFSPSIAVDIEPLRPATQDVRGVTGR